ncbi:CerR family C-terminal domain-containing protein [Oceanirhabdus seepicola]|uniref:CerR family C-terminal domain-containing protein n=1 Tax=Oceanirhabdus seepicola TaxID=2828781 RepID=A0A9J6NYC4_9CLOT|nr:CerR family C-terminal domain-containing protein [Oceanirhabdus seepicola]MCM1989052.1 CerR family C-terminal domain-containing protein [Oceanirhabdus seepicola]
MEKNTDSKSNVEQRILKAAGKIFAKKGFKNASVREICKSAEVNTAAINYYFGNKESLYIEVVKHWKNIAFEKYPFDFAEDESNPPEDRLRYFIKCVLLHTLYEIESPWFGTFMSRESIEPTKAIQELTEDSIGPAIDLLFSIVKALLGKNANDETIRLYSSSILGQCTFYQYSPHIIKKHFEISTLSLAEIEKIADNIYSFSLNAIKGFTD